MQTVKGKRRYGCWAGYPSGSAEDPKCCIAEVWSRESYSHGHQCNRPRGHGKDGLYCKQHDPETVEAKRNARNAKWDAEFKAKQDRWDKKAKEEKALEASKDALEKIAAGHNDPRTLAMEILKLFPPD